MTKYLGVFISEDEEQPVVRAVEAASQTAAEQALLSSFADDYGADDGGALNGVLYLYDPGLPIPVGGGVEEYGPGYRPTH